MAEGPHCSRHRLTEIQTTRRTDAPDLLCRGHVLNLLANCTRAANLWTDLAPSLCHQSALYDFWFAHGAAGHACVRRCECIRNLHRQKICTAGQVGVCNIRDWHDESFSLRISCNCTARGYCYHADTQRAGLYNLPTIEKIWLGLADLLGKPILTIASYLSSRFGGTSAPERRQR